MFIKKITLEDFRNYEREEIEFNPKVNIILGENAQGKTNLIESIYLTAIGKSFRTSKDRELIKFKKEFCRVSALFEKEEEGSVQVVISKEGKKAAKIDGRKVERASELLDNIFVVVFSPEDLKIIKEDPAKRRNFINRELSQLKLSYLNNLKIYNRVLAQRNAYLKENKYEKESLELWDEIIIDVGSKIMKERADFISKLSDISKDIHSKITNEKEVMNIKYRPNIEISNGEKSQKELIKEALKEGLESDLYKRNTGRGPHRDDIEIIINNINARNYGSQGQQRTAALSLKLAEINLLKEEKGENPILLLDDVLSELDNERQKYLIDSLKDIQMFITTTDLTEEVKNSLPVGKTIRIEAGKVKEYS